MPARRESDLPAQPGQPTQQVATGFRQTTVSFSGPLPHPDILAKYNDAFPDGAQKIFNWATEQTQHRMALEKKVVDSNIRKERLGQLMAFALSVIVIGIGAFFTYLGLSLTGVAMVITPLAWLAGTFIYSKIHGRKELKKKAADLVRQSPGPTE